MTAHLSSEVLGALADGELPREELAVVEEHLAECAACTSRALAQTLLKSAVFRAGQRYAASADFGERLSRLVAHRSTEAAASAAGSSRTLLQVRRGTPAMAWVAAALLLVAACGVWFVSARGVHRQLAATEEAMVTEVFDQHVATLGAGTPPEVLSSDNHTVKPWFQGKLPFAFNLPEVLPTGMVLQGANLTYLRGQPAAQLLFSIGRHRVSVFVAEKAQSGASEKLPTEHAGFRVMSFSGDDLEMVAVSDVNPSRLAELMRALQSAQNPGAN